MSTPNRQEGWFPSVRAGQAAPLPGAGGGLMEAAEVVQIPPLGDPAPSCRAIWRRGRGSCLTAEGWLFLRTRPCLADLWLHRQLSEWSSALLSLQVKA